MAAVDYSGILTALQTIFQGDVRTSAFKVHVEEDPVFGLSDDQQAIALFLVTRRLVPGQSLAAGKRTRYEVRIGVWTIGFSMSNFAAAEVLRDAALAQVELVLMDNRTISGKVESSWLDGGDFLSARNPGANVFSAMVETILLAQVSAINV